MFFSRKTTSSGGGLADAAGVRVGGSGDWTPPPGHKRIPSPARAAELEAEVGWVGLGWVGVGWVEDWGGG